MRVPHYLCALLIGAVAAPAAAQDAQDLLAKNLAARGGAAAIAALDNVSFEGRMLFPGDFELTYKETRSRVGGAARSRVDMGLQGLNLVQAYDGSGGWRINPFQGRKDAERMSGDEARSEDGSDGRNNAAEDGHTTRSITNRLAQVILRV